MPRSQPEALDAGELPLLCSCWDMSCWMKELMLKDGDSSDKLQMGL